MAKPKRRPTSSKGFSLTLQDAKGRMVGRLAVELPGVRVPAALVQALDELAASIGAQLNDVQKQVFDVGLAAGRATAAAIDKPARRRKPATN